MIEPVNKQVDVMTLSKKGQGIVVPMRIRWDGRLYTIRKVGLRHPKRQGRVLYHIFECTDGNLFFRLSFNTESLQWILEAISDGLPT